MRYRLGFTLVELLVTIGIFAILATLSSVNFSSTYSQSSLGTARDVLLADLKTAQSNAMSGKGDSGTAVEGWGIKVISPTEYVLFPGSTYASNPLNVETELASGITISTTFDDNEVAFAHGSGEVVDYVDGQATITLNYGSTSNTIRLNQYGTSIGE